MKNERIFKKLIKQAENQGWRFTHRMTIKRGVDHLDLDRRVSEFYRFGKLHIGTSIVGRTAGRKHLEQIDWDDFINNPDYGVLVHSDWSAIGDKGQFEFIGEDNKD